MARYSVMLTRDITQSCIIEVDADNEDDAADKAIERERSRGDQFRGQWTTADAPCSSPVLAGGLDDVELLPEPCPIHRQPIDRCGYSCNGTGPLDTPALETSFHDHEMDV